MHPFSRERERKKSFSASQDRWGHLSFPFFPKKEKERQESWLRETPAFPYLAIKLPLHYIFCTIPLRKVLPFFWAPPKKKMFWNSPQKAVCLSVCWIHCLFISFYCLSEFFSCCYFQEISCKEKKNQTSKTQLHLPKQKSEKKAHSFPYTNNLDAPAIFFLPKFN